MKGQHSAISELAEKVTQQSRRVASEPDAEQVVKTMQQLDDLLKAHLAAEDTFLYPAMKASPDTEAAGIASRYSDEVGDLIDRYLAFTQRWAGSDKILADPGVFRSEWQTLLCALSIRIEREDAVLYPLAESMHGDIDRKTA